MSAKSIALFSAFQRDNRRTAKTEPPPPLEGNVDEMMAQAEAFEQVARAARRSARELRVMAGRLREQERKH